MSKGKLEKFEEVSEFENTLELTDFQDDVSQKPKGRWNSDIFQNDNPIVFELACGKGEYTLELARRNPNRNYIGIDIKGARIWKGAKKALEEGLENVRFMRMYIDHLDEYFAPKEIDEIWITFPDPYPRKPDQNKRLTSPKFLNIYKKVVKPETSIHFKTDDDELFDYTLNVLEEFDCEIQDVVHNIYKERPGDPLLTHKTYYERKHLEKGRTISYCKFCLS